MIEIYIDENLSEYVADALNSLNKYKIGIFFIKMQWGTDKHWEIVKLLINSRGGNS